MAYPPHKTERPLNMEDDPTGYIDYLIATSTGRELVTEMFRTIVEIRKDVAELREFVDKASEQIESLADGGIMGLVSGMLSGG